MNYHYNVDFEINGLVNTIQVEAANPGQAFACCLKEVPNAVLKKCWIYGRQGDVVWEQEFDPPPVQREVKPEPRAPRPLKRDNRDCVLPFYDEVKSKRP